MTSTADDQSKQVTGYPTMNPTATAAVSSGNRSDAQPSYPNANGGTTYPGYPAYPYAAPPPGAYYYPDPSYYDQQRRRASFLRCLIIIVLTVFVIFCAISFIIWLVLRPRVPEFQLDSASVSSFNVSTFDITANWDVGFTVRNPNEKLRVYYGSFVSYMLYDREELAETSLPPFDQGTRNQTTMRARFAATSTYVSNSAAQSMAVDRSRGSVNFNVNLLSWVRFKSGLWRTRRHLMSVYCSNIRVSFSSNSGVGSLSGGSRGCDVYV